jgi:hypothetical protein
MPHWRLRAQARGFWSAAVTRVFGRGRKARQHPDRGVIADAGPQDNPRLDRSGPATDRDMDHPPSCGPNEFRLEAAPPSGQVTGRGSRIAASTSPIALSRISSA